VADPLALTEGLLALHATDPATVYLSAAARMTQPDHPALERAQYDTRELVRMLAMRRTMFVVSAGAAPVVQAAASDAIAEQLRRQYAQLLEGAGVAGDGAAWLARAGAAALESLRRSGELTGAELGRATPLLQTKIALAEGKAYSTNSNVTGWVANMLAAEGRIVRGRPLGSWTGNQYRWQLADRTPRPAGPEARAAARAELARRWLVAFGPATVADVQWWTGWNLGETRAALASIRAATVDLDGTPGVVMADDNEPAVDPGPWVALLPALDSTPMGWRRRDWYLGDHGAALFDRSGNIGPTVWVEGRIVGGWAQRTNGEVVFRLLEDVGGRSRSAIAESAERMRQAIGDKRITPRIRTPLERELVR